MIFETIRDAIYYSYNSSETFLNINTQDIFEITHILMNLISSCAISNENDFMFELLSISENLMFLYLFHFHIEFNYLGNILLKFFLDNLDFEYHKEILQNVIKIIQIVKVKKSVNSIVCSKIITNMSQCVTIILNNTNNDTRKCFYDFIKLNSEDYIFSYILCDSTCDELNFSKMYPNEKISELIEKYSKELEKQLKVAENFITKDDKTLTSKTRIKQSIDIINCICKVMDSFTIRGSRSYNIDKQIKGIIPSIKRFWNLILFNSNLYVYLYNNTL
jgi:hypothetical protein